MSSRMPPRREGAAVPSRRESVKKEMDNLDSETLGLHDDEDEDSLDEGRSEDGATPAARRAAAQGGAGDDPYREDEDEDFFDDDEEYDDEEFGEEDSQEEDEYGWVDAGSYTCSAWHGADCSMVTGYKLQVTSY